MDDAPTSPGESPTGEPRAVGENAFDPDGFDPDGFDADADEEFAPHRRQRLSKPTALLAVLVVAAGGFLAGAYVQKTQAPATASTTARTTGGAAAFAGLGRGAGRTSGTGGGASGAAGGSGGASTSATPSADAGPAVIGQIVKVNGNTVVVQNLGGQQVTVTLGQDTQVSKSATVGDLAPGQTVTVSGSAGAGGAVDATTVVTK